MAVISFRRLIMAALLLAPPSIAFGGHFRGLVARNIFASSRTLAAIRVRGGGDDGQQSFRIYSSSSSSTNELPIPNISLPSSFEERREDVTVALMSVLAACRVTRHVQPTSSKAIETISKQDASPVTVGDFASQALALHILHNRFPYDMFIAEEGSEALQQDAELLNKVWEAVNHAQHEGLLLDKKKLMSAIDYGQGVNVDNEQSTSSVSKRRKVWCLDPIDGTKGFLRGRVEGGQYCIALALIEDGVPVLSVLGCPNLPLPSTTGTATVPYGLWSEDEVQESESHPSSLFSTTRGCLFVAIRGCGCYEIPLHLIEEYLLGNDDTSTKDASTTWKQLHVTPNDGSCKSASHAKFCLGVERAFSDPKGTVLKIAQTINGPDSLTTDSDGLQDIKNSMRMDGQGKYGILARGDAEYFLRLPKEGYVDWVWDVAAGYLILKEAGGTMTDVHGQPIDFSEIGIDRRAKLPDHVMGILGSCGGVFHEALVDAHAKVEQI